MNRLACYLALAIVGSACGGMRATVGAARVATNTEQLTRSLFARDTQGQLTEAAIQQILAAPMELELPARVGVLPVIAAQDWRGPGPSYDMATIGMSEFAKGLPSADAFGLVTEMMPIPSGALGMEALREIAARYKLRYIVLYRENVVQRIRANGWMAGYATIVGALFLPGSTLHVQGYVEASLFDVKTGLLLFTVRRRVRSQRDTNEWHHGDKLESMQITLATKVANKLAEDVRRSVFQFARAVELENSARLAHRAKPSEAPVPSQPTAAR